MKLFSNALSPYVRKVAITMDVKGLRDNIDLVHTDTNNPDNSEFFKANPLAKVPALVTDDGAAIFDSKVICEYLDLQAPAPRLFPTATRERIRTLALGALADGVLDAALLLVYEKRFRPEEKWHAPWQQRQQDKIARSIDYLEKNLPQWHENPDYGHITTACALGYLDFRHDGAWRRGHPSLVAWLDEFAKTIPAFEKTRPKT